MISSQKKFSWNPRFSVPVWNKPFMLKPYRTYDITLDISFPQFIKVDLKNKVRVDHGIVFMFTNIGIIRSLSFNRFDNNNFFQKVNRNHNM